LLVSPHQRTYAPTQLMDSAEERPTLQDTLNLLHEGQ
jgi:hypothetical protein